MPGWRWAHANFLFALPHRLEDPAELLDQTRQITRRFAGAENTTHSNDRSPDRRLKIAYMSQDFRTHSISFFIEPILRNHDRQQYEVFCYSDVAAPDVLTHGLRGLADCWRNIAPSSTAEVVDRIRRDGIDILVDLTLYSHSGKRIPVLASRPAPVQATYLAYASTSGHAAIDWRITDAYIDPPGECDSYSSERLMRLPYAQWAYQPPDVCPEVNALPALDRGYVTFGSTNQLRKVTPDMLRLWGQILARLPNSRLHMKAGSLVDPGTRELILKQLTAANGVGRDRIELSGPVGLDQYMHYFHGVDIVLDTYPFAGGTTSCHSLWMGVPVVTLAGRTSISRVGVSLLSNVGLADLVAQAPDSYVNLAAGLANDLPRLGALRRELRQRMLMSPLCDAKALTSHLERGYRQMWQEWCAQSAR